MKGGDDITLLNQNKKQELKGGSFYAVALGIGILVSTVASLVCNIVDAAKPNATTTAYASRRSGAMIRLSPVPSRSSITII